VGKEEIIGVMYFYVDFNYMSKNPQFRRKLFILKHEMTDSKNKVVESKYRIFNHKRQKKQRNKYMYY
jgi:hypothetical protein